MFSHVLLWVSEACLINVFLSGPPNAEDFVKLQGWLSHCCWKLPGEPTGEGFVFL